MIRLSGIILAFFLTFLCSMGKCFENSLVVTPEIMKIATRAFINQSKIQGNNDYQEQIKDLQIVFTMKLYYFDYEKFLNADLDKSKIADFRVNSHKHYGFLLNDGKGSLIFFISKKESTFRYGGSWSCPQCVDEARAVIYDLKQKTKNVKEIYYQDCYWGQKYVAIFEDGTEQIFDVSPSMKCGPNDVKEFLLFAKEYFQSAPRVYSD